MEEQIKGEEMEHKAESAAVEVMQPEVSTVSAAPAERRRRRPLRAWFRLCPVRHSLLLLSALVIGFHFLHKDCRKLMIFLSEHLIRPFHDFCALKMAETELSVAELVIVGVTVLLLLYLVISLILLFKKKGKLKRVYRMVISLITLGSFVYAGFCALWGVYYYGDDFLEQSGLKQDPISVEQLYIVTEYFAGLANEFSGTVERDSYGSYTPNREAILDRSHEVFAATVSDFRCLEGPDVNAKGFRMSAFLSYIDFTGFYFPFTSEANVNTDFPGGLFAATVAHELSHQRGVAKEQEANFVAVLTSLNYGDADYCYSAALLAYTYLGNALYKADPALWQNIYDGLDERVLQDLKEGNEYWARLDTPVKTVSNTVYDGFLRSYDQELGLKSYGACVDLLVNYYYDDIAAEAAFE